MIDLFFAEALDERRRENAETVKRPGLRLALALGSLVFETAGLALAAARASEALATPNPKRRPPVCMAHRRPWHTGVQSR